MVERLHSHLLTHIKFMKCVSFYETWLSTCTTGDTLIIGLDNGIERKEIVYLSYDGLEGKKIIHVSYNGLEMYASVCN